MRNVLLKHKVISELKTWCQFSLNYFICIGNVCYEFLLWDFVETYGKVANIILYFNIIVAFPLPLFHRFNLLYFMFVLLYHRLCDIYSHHHLYCHPLHPVGLRKTLVYTSSSNVIQTQIKGGGSSPC